MKVLKEPNKKMVRRKTMGKRLFRVTLVAAGSALLSLAILFSPIGNVAAYGNSGGVVTGLEEANTTSVGQTQTNALADAEKSWLTYMREEEKLARDVYRYLFDKWDSRIFSNISTSEQRHMDTLKTLLDGYGVPDPTAGKGRGEFSDPKLQALYDKLIQQGSTSIVEALKVGVIIEKTDMDDLHDAIASTTLIDVKTVYNNILGGSLNHLSAFNSNLARHGVTY